MPSLRYLAFPSAPRAVTRLREAVQRIGSVVTDDAGRILPPVAQAEICVRGDQVMKGCY